MGAPRDRRHIFLTGFVTRSSYKGKGGPREKPPVPTGGRTTHGARLQAELHKAEVENNSNRNEQHAAHGVFIEFESIPGWELAVAKLDKRTGTKIPVVSVRTTQVDGNAIQFATVFVPEGELSFFLGKLNDYVKTIPPKKGRMATPRPLRSNQHHSVSDNPGLLDGCRC